MEIWRERERRTENQFEINLNGSSAWVAIKLQMKYQTQPKIPTFDIGHTAHSYQQTTAK